MKYTPVDEAASRLGDLLTRAARFNEPIGIAGPDGNGILISEEEYDAMMETIFIMRSKEAREGILEAAAEDLEESIGERDVQW